MKRRTLLVSVAAVLGAGASGVTWLGARIAKRESEIQCKRNLLDIHKGLTAYRNEHGVYPPWALVDENGSPAHSWRVLLLPYIGYQHLYNRYRFDEPWDSSQNSMLSAEMPVLYASPLQPSVGTRTGITPYLAVTGPNSGWGHFKGRTPQEFTDGLVGTICIIEDSSSTVNWMQPEDAAFQGNPSRIARWIGAQDVSHQPHCLFFAGECFQLPPTTSPEILDGMMTCNGGEDVSQFFRELLGGPK